MDGIRLAVRKEDKPGAGNWNRQGDIIYVFVLDDTNADKNAEWQLGVQGAVRHWLIDIVTPTAVSREVFTFLSCAIDKDTDTRRAWRFKNLPPGQMNAAEVEPGWYRFTLADARTALLNKTQNIDFSDYLSGSYTDECFTEETRTALVALLTDWGLL